MAELYPAVNIYQIFIIHSFIEEYLAFSSDCIVSKEAINMAEQVSGGRVLRFLAYDGE